MSYSYTLLNNLQEHNKILCHTDISPLNIVFNKFGIPKKIIDFDELDLVDFSYDLIFTICTCVNLGEWNTSNFGRKAKKVIFFLSKYGDKNLIYHIFENFDSFISYTMTKYRKRMINNLNEKSEWLNSIKKFFDYWKIIEPMMQ